MLEPPNNEYMRKLGTPGPTQLLAGAVNGSVMPGPLVSGKPSLLPVENPGAMVRANNCDLLIGSGGASIVLSYTSM